MARIGFITALKSEAGCLEGVLGQTSLLNFVSGIGPDAATRAAELAVNAECDTLVSFGYAGALDPTLRTGDLMCGLSVANEDIIIHSDKTIITRLESFIDETSDIRSKSSRIYGSSHVLHSVTQKLDLWKKGAWEAVDMESISIGYTAQQHGLTFLIVRAILDTTVISPPTGLSRITDENGHVRSGRALWEVVKNPKIAPRYAVLAAARRQANQTLRRVAPLLVRSILDGR